MGKLKSVGAMASFEGAFATLPCHRFDGKRARPGAQHNHDPSTVVFCFAARGTAHTHNLPFKK